MITGASELLDKTLGTLGYEKEIPSLQRRNLYVTCAVHETHSADNYSIKLATLAGLTNAVCDIPCCFCI
jgi:hypothetical protein